MRRIVWGRKREGRERERFNGGRNGERRPGKGKKINGIRVYLLYVSGRKLLISTVPISYTLRYTFPISHFQLSCTSLQAYTS